MNPFRLLLVCIALLPAIVRAELPSLSAVTARYKVIVNGIPAGTAATISVQPLGRAGQYEATFNVRNRFFNHREISRFDWQSCQVTAREYRHDFSGLGIERHSALQFDQSRGIAIETRGDRRTELPLAPDVTDALNMGMLSRCRLRDGLKAFSLPVIYRGERKDYSFTVAGKETVETPAGTWEAVVVSRDYPQGGRRTRVWVAPDLDWFMVRFEHVENPVARGSMVLTGFEEDATAKPPLAGSAAPATGTSTRGRKPRTETTP